MLEPDGEERVRLLFGGAAQDHASDERLIEESLELRFEGRLFTVPAWREQKLRVLLAVD